MSFYLLPPVSYQKQQQLKSQAKDRKHKSHSASRKPSVASSTSSPSVLTKYSTCNSIEEQPGMDVASLASTKSKKSAVSDSTSTRKKAHTYNYDFNAELNEIIRSSSRHSHGKRKSRKSGESASSTRSNDNSSSASVSGAPLVSANASFAHFTISKSRQPEKGINDDSPVAPTAVESRPHQLGIIDDKNEAVNSDNEENELTTVFSDVASIFSTRGSSVPVDTSTDPTASSLKTKFKKKFFDQRPLM